MRAKGTALLPLYMATMMCMTARAQNQPNINVEAQQQIRELVSSLPRNSAWRRLLLHGMHGDGIVRAWMLNMARQHVRLAEITLDFSWRRGGRSIGEWRAVQAEYFRDYDGRQRIQNPHRLRLIEASGLSRQLAAAGLKRAQRKGWVDYPSGLGSAGTGFIRIYLASSPWLPTGQQSPFLVSYNLGTTPLMHAAEIGDAERVRKLLTAGEQVNATDPAGNTALAYAAGSGDPDTVRVLLRAGAAGPLGRALSDAAVAGSTAAVEVLLNAGAHGLDHALVAAVVNDEPATVRLLLEKGADPNSRDSEGKEVLQIACGNGNVTIEKLLRNAGARHRRNPRRNR